MEDLTLENFAERTGRRFKVSASQSQRIKEGTLTREQAFREFLDNGGLQQRQGRVIPRSVFMNPELTLDNFSDLVEQETGVRRRFRASPDQLTRIRSGELTREQAFNEFLTSQRAEETDE